MGTMVCGTHDCAFGWIADLLTGCKVDWFACCLTLWRCTSRFAKFVTNGITAAPKALRMARFTSTAATDATLSFIKELWWELTWAS